MDRHSPVEVFESLLKLVIAVLLIWALPARAHDESVDVLRALPLSELLAKRAEYSKDEREQVIVDLKKPEFNTPSSRSITKRTLAIFGDHEALKEMVSEFLRDDAMGTEFISLIKQPRVIPLLGEALYRENDVFKSEET